MTRPATLLCLAAVFLPACASRGAAPAAGPGPVAEAPAEADLGAFRVFRGDGRPAALAAIFAEMEVATVLVVQEEPGDSIGARVAETLAREGPRRWPGRPFVLSPSDGGDRIAERPDALVLHRVASASVEPLGVVEAFRRAHPSARVVLVRMRRVRDPADFESFGSVDFVVLTRR